MAYYIFDISKINYQLTEKTSKSKQVKILNSTNKWLILHQNATKCDKQGRGALPLGEELNPDVFVVSEQGFQHKTIGMFKTHN